VVLTVLGGKGGGSPTKAQGTGSDVAKIQQAMDVAQNFAEDNTRAK